jgi:hypothetical protein
MSAYKDLQRALGEAGYGDEIRVAEGTYLPGDEQSDQSVTFRLPSGVVIRGGYAGFGTENPDERNIQKRRTLLSGDVRDDDGEGFENYENNVHHVITIPSGAEEVLLDGLVVTGGNALHTPNSQNEGGGLIMRDATVTVRDCVFSRNRARSGGGMAADASSVTIVGCTFRENWAQFGGGGLYLHHDCNVTLLESTFELNHADGRGGGVLDEGFASIDVHDCTFTANDAGGAAGLSVSAAMASVQRCRFVANQAGGSAGLFLGRGTRAEVGGCEFLSNVASPRGGGGAGVWEVVQVNFRDCRFRENRAEEEAGGLEIDLGTVLLSSCEFLGNTCSGSGYGSGGAIHSHMSDLEIRRSLFAGNHSEYQGGGVLATARAFKATDTVFSGNSTDGTGGAVSTVRADTVLTRCTISENTSATPGGAGLRVFEYVPILSSNVIWGNRDADGASQSAQLLVVNEGPDINYSIVQGWIGDLGGVGNNGDDPEFIDADGPDDVPGTADDNVRVQPTSPAIDTGDPDYDPPPGTGDLDGHARVLCGRVDRGAYEFGIGDFDCNRVVELDDYAAWADCMTGPDGGPYPSGCEAFDFEFDGDVDLLDFARYQEVSGP